ncbi:hypothetical protein PHET_09325, partial [Paragonimus heterotremus]
SAEGAAHANCGYIEDAHRGVILGVNPVRVVGPTDDILTDAFSDSGSDTTLVSPEPGDPPNLAGKPPQLKVTTVAGLHVIPGEAVPLKIRSLDSKDEVAVDRVYSVPSLRMRSQADAVRSEICKRPQFKSIPKCKIPSKRVTSVIGNGILRANCALDQRLVGIWQPYSRKTFLDWMLLGLLGCHERKLIDVNCSQRIDASTAEHIQRLYNMKFADTEKFTCSQPVKADSAASIAKNTTLLTNGHYAIALPWRHAETKLPNNRMVAGKCLQNLNNGIIRDSDHVSRKQ